MKITKLKINRINFIKIFIIFILNFSSIIIISQTTELDLDKKNNWIDGITLIPLNAQFVLSKSNSEIFETGDFILGVSFHPQIILHKKIKSNINVFTGIGYSNSIEVAKISKGLEEFSTLLEINWSSLQSEDSLLNISLFTYQDEFLNIPIGVRLYSHPIFKGRIRGTFSSKLEASFLLNSKVDVNVVEPVEFTFLVLPITYNEQVFNTTYEEEAEINLENRSRKFLINFQFGLGYEWNTGKHFSFGHEVVVNGSLRNHKKNLLKNKTMIGLQLRLVYHFE